jgi:hypothetical protein
VAVETVPIGQNRVVDVQVFQDFDDSKWGAGEKALLALGFRVEEANVLVHVEDVTVAKALYILGNVDNLLEILVLSVVEDGVVYDDAVDVGVNIRG